MISFTQEFGKVITPLYADPVTIMLCTCCTRKNQVQINKGINYTVTVTEKGCTAYKILVKSCDIIIQLHSQVFEICSATFLITFPSFPWHISEAFVDFVNSHVQ